MKASPVAGQRWDIQCRVIDNLGDAAVLWRLARQLADEHGIAVRLFVDRDEALARLVPGARPDLAIEGVQIKALGAEDRADPATELGRDCDVLISGFVARTPPAARARLLRGKGRLGGSAGGLLVQLEHLSAEPWVDGCHGLPSPGGDGLTEHWFYPGFSRTSGGLIREADLLARRDAFRADKDAAAALLARLGVQRRPGALTASLLCYPDPPLAALARRLAAQADIPSLDLVAPGLPDMPGAAGADVRQLDTLSAGRLRLLRVPFLSQRDYDMLLWSCDLNIVRGEDSWLRAIWSGLPMLWRAYPQTEGTDRVKLDAFLSRLGGGASAGLLADAHRWWNDPDEDASPLTTLLRALTVAGEVTSRFSSALASQPDLATRLVAFVRQRQIGNALGSGPL